MNKNKLPYNSIISPRNIQLNNNKLKLLKIKKKLRIIFILVRNKIFNKNEMLNELYKS